MDQQTLINILKTHLSGELHAPRASGRDEIARVLSEEGHMTFEQAEKWVDTLETQGHLCFVEVAPPSSPAMLEAARYGEMPAPGTAVGYWRIGRA
jgi:hypothetical protein